MGRPRMPLKPTIAPNASVVRSPIPTTVDVSIAQGRGRRRYHFPGAVRLTDGTILAAARLGIEHVDHRGEIQLVRSEDEGRTWSPPTTIWSSRGDDRDPKLSVTKSGRVFVQFFTRKDRRSPKDVDNGVFVMHSDDGGRSWSDAVEVEAEGKGAVACHGAVTEMPDGSLLAPVYDAKRSMVLRSTDGGLTFPQSSQYVFDSGKVKTNEVTLIAHSSGTVFAWLRNAVDGEVSLVYRSTDSGHTWSEPEVCDIRQSSADALELDDGRLLLAWGDLSHRFGLRRVTCAAIVDDPTQPWQPTPPAPIWDAFNNDQGNPALAQLADGTVLMVATDYASRQLIGKIIAPSDLDRAPHDDAQFRDAIDLRELIEQGIATVRTDLGSTLPKGPTNAGPLGAVDRRLGLTTAAMGDADDLAHGHFTIMFAEPYPVSEIGVALRPGENQAATIGVADRDGDWRRVAELDHGWRFGDIDWVEVGKHSPITGIRVATTTSDAERPPNSGKRPLPLAISQIAIRRDDGHRDSGPRTVWQRPIL